MNYPTEPTQSHRDRAQSATFERAIVMGCCPTTARALGRQARRECRADEVAEETAFRLARAMQASAMVPA